MNVRNFWDCAMEYTCALTRPQLIPSSPKIIVNGVRIHVNSKGKIQKVLRKVKPMMLHHTGQPAQHTTDWAVTGQPAQHTTDWAIPASLYSELHHTASHRTTSSTHYWLSHSSLTVFWITSHCITQDSQLNTLPNWAVPASLYSELHHTASHRTTSSTHYPTELLQDSQPNTTWLSHSSPTVFWVNSPHCITQDPTHYLIKQFQPYCTLNHYHTDLSECALQ